MTGGVISGTAYYLNYALGYWSSANLSQTGLLPPIGYGAFIANAQKQGANINDDLGVYLGGAFVLGLVLYFMFKKKRG